jgi:hypothetical protein
MRTPYRNRCRSTVALVCLALILCAGTASALSAVYTVAENGTSYSAEIEIVLADKYAFTEPGLLGAPVPVAVSGLFLFNATGAVNYTEDFSGAIRFPNGNYTIHYVAPLKSNELTVLLAEPSTIRVSLPEQYGIKNPLLGHISAGGVANATENGTMIIWENARSAQVRYYDAFQEQMLVIFGTFWIALVVIFLVPYLIVNRKKE